MEKTFDAAAAEARIAARWEAEGCFRAGANARPGAESFCIVIPPPNVTGSLHMGHALNNTIQDILVRWHRMRGHDTLWQPGQDHAGIATQMVVERQLAEEGNEGRREMGREKFVERVWQWKEESGDTIIGQLRRLGASCDWERNRFTMDEGLSAAVLEMFVRLHEEGLIYRAKRLVNWDPKFETAISDLEVEQREEKGHLWRFRYRLADGVTFRFPVAHDEDGEPTEWEERDYLTVATTRPETMLGDTGVAVHPDDARYAGIVGRDVILPLVGRRIPVVADAYADPEKGTGAVKITPAHDFNDFEVGKRCNLKAINVMGPKAEIRLEGNADFLEGIEPDIDCMALDGHDRYDARKRIVALAEEQGWLDGIDAEVHVVPHGDRSGVAIEPYLTDQWFVDAKTLAQPALEAVRKGDTRFVPENWEKTYFNWLENIEPWCISRQLWWGHQIPVWYGPLVEGDDDVTEYGRLRVKRFCAKSAEHAIEMAKLYYGSETVEISHLEPVGLPEAMLQRLHGSVRHVEARAPRLFRDPDVLDTWFSSALWPFSTLGWPKKTAELERYYKTDVLVTGFDIIFFWVARMMMFGLKAMEEVPFHTVYINAIVRDEHGRKMSKSIGNVIDPLELIDKYGADALRFTLASMEALGRNDIKMSENRVEGYRNFGTKLWNAARFAGMNGAAPVPGFDPASPKETVNRWIVGETVRVAGKVHQALKEFRFSDAAGALYAHVWGTFCDWYVEFTKPLLLGEDGPAKEETRATVAWALDQCLTLLHPFMPFITEELWGETGRREKMLVHTDWPEFDAALADPAADAEMGWVVRLIEAVRSVRAEMNVPAGAEVPLILTDPSPDAMARLARNRPLILRLARIGEVTVGPAPKGAVTIPLEGAVASLPLAGVIDVAAERARLGKARDKAGKDIRGLEGKLGNAKFLEKAPAEVVEEQRARLAAAEAEAAKLDAALARLEELE